MDKPSPIFRHCLKCQLEKGLRNLRDAKPSEVGQCVEVIIVEFSSKGTMNKAEKSVAGPGQAMGNMFRAEEEEV